MGVEAFDVETFSETARRSSQRLLASAAACKKQWTIASLDINMAFLKELTDQELAEATGERNAWCVLLCRLDRPRRFEPTLVSNATASQKHRLQHLKPGTGAKDAPRAFPLKLRRTTRGFGLRPTSYDEEFETSNNLLTAKHLDDINMAGTEETVDNHVKCVEDTF
eukprot:8480837-Pyramimonas_sp.AAC.1